MKKNALIIAMVAVVILWVLYYTRDQHTLIVNQSTIVSPDVQNNISKFIIHTENDVVESYAMLNVSEKSILGKISMLYLSEVNKEQNYSFVESNKDYYKPESISLYYYDKNIALVNIQGNYFLYDINSNTLKEKASSRSLPLMSENYLVVNVNENEIIYYKRGTMNFSKIEKPFVLNNNETFYSSCVVEGLCIADTILIENNLIIGIYQNNTDIVNGAQTNKKIREISIVLK